MGQGCLKTNLGSRLLIPLDSVALARHNRDMNTTSTAAVKEIWIKSTKAGRRAFEWSFACNRVMPVRMADAELGLATGRMVQINMSWVDALRTGCQVEFV